MTKDSGNCYLQKNTFTCKNVIKTKLSKLQFQRMLLLSYFTTSGLYRVNIAVFSLFRYSRLRGKNAVRDKSALPFTARSSSLTAGSLLREHVRTWCWVLFLLQLNTQCFNCYCLSFNMLSQQQECIVSLFYFAKWQLNQNRRERLDSTIGIGTGFHNFGRVIKKKF